ncbi:MAG: FUSC family protein [Candidatus Nanopelagicales bacterium]
MTGKVMVRRLLQTWGFVIYLLVPTSIVSYLISPDLVELGIFAAAVGALATLMQQSWRVGLWQVCIFAVLGYLAALASPYPVLGGLLMAACGVALGICSRWAWQYSAFLMPILLIAILINPIPATQADVTAHTLATQGGGIAVSTFFVLLAAGLLSLLLCIPILHHMNKKHAPMKLPGLAPEVSWYYAILLGILLGLATWFVLAYERVPDMSWLLLTLVLLLNPTSKLSTKKAIVRTVGTLVGSLIAVLIALIPSHGVVVVITILLTGAATVVVFDTANRYWLWIVLWTPSIILLTSQSTNIIAATEFRLGMTVVAGAIVLGIAFAVLKLHPKRLHEVGFV